MKASDVMTSRVVTIHADETLRIAAERMLAHHISGLPVLDDGRLVGMLTEGDLLRRAEIGTERRRARWLEWLVSPGTLAEEYVGTHGRRVAEVMTGDVIAVGPETPLVQVVKLMENHRIKRLPVVDAGKVIGLVSRSDLVKALLFRLDAEAATSPTRAGDEAIRASLMAAIEREQWGPRHLVDVVVFNGVVQFSGTVLSESTRQALHVLAENTPGVRAIHDHMIWLEPVTGLTLPSPEEMQAEKPTAAATG